MICPFFIEHVQLVLLKRILKQAFWNHYGIHLLELGYSGQLFLSLAVLTSVLF